MKICVVKWAWSSNDWQGFDPDESYYEDDVTKSKYNFVKNEGYGYEWWNFCDRDGYYYIHLPTEKDRTCLRDAINSDPSNVAFVISKNIHTGETCLIAILEDVECLDSPKTIHVGPGCTPKALSFRHSITGNPIKTPIKIKYHFRVKKEDALIFWGDTKPIINQADCFGKSLGIVNCSCDVDLDKIVKCLSSLEVDKEIKERIRKIIEKIQKEGNTNENRTLGEANKKDKKLGTLLEKSRNLILYGPPGTGKTYLAKKLAKAVAGSEDRITLIQFHPSYSYEDFVRGITVNSSGRHINYAVVDRIFVKMCEKAKNDPDRKYVLIIDEINRADLSRVLGELIYALEYRGEPVNFLYTSPGMSDTLTVPENLYLIGTMNTADRSIGYIDYAVRRRFVFKKVPPSKEELSKFYQNIGNSNLKEQAEQLFENVAKIFKDADCLSPDYTADEVQPGHTYFMAKDEEELWLKFCYQVWPLLQEYIRDGVLLCRQCDEKACTLNPRKGLDDCEDLDPENLKLGKISEKESRGGDREGAPTEGANQPEGASSKGAEE